MLPPDQTQPRRAVLDHDLQRAQLIGNRASVDEYRRSHLRLPHSSRCTIFVGRRTARSTRKARGWRGRRSARGKSLGSLVTHRWSVCAARRPGPKRAICSMNRGSFPLAKTAGPRSLDRSSGELVHGKELLSTCNCAGHLTPSRLRSPRQLPGWFRSGCHRRSRRCVAIAVGRAVVAGRGIRPAGEELAEAVLER